MSILKDLTVDDLENLIEQKVRAFGRSRLRAGTEAGIQRRIKPPDEEPQCDNITSRGDKKVCLKSSGLKKQ